MRTAPSTWVTDLLSRPVGLPGPTHAAWSTTGGAALTSPDTDRLDAVELKVTLAGADVDRAVLEFGPAGRAVRHGRVWFAEVAGPRHPVLLDAGLILGLHAETGEGGMSQVLLRPCRPGQVAPGWAVRGRSPGHLFGIEGDWRPGSRVVAASLRHRPADLRRPLRAFSALQRRFVEECADTVPRPRDLRLLGPIDTSRWPADADGLRIAVDHWTAPVDLVQLSTRTTPGDAALVEPVLAACVRRRGLDLGLVTRTRTRIVLEYLLGAG